MKVLGTRLIKSTILVVAVAVVVLSFAVPRAQRTEGPTGPSTWVAFTADMVRTAPGGSVYGHFFRDADGSTRLESGPSLTDMRLIDVKNVTEEATYYFTEQTGWTRHPMKLEGKGWLPQTRPSRPPSEGRAVQYENFEGWTLTGPNGQMEIQIPALNFFAADSSRANGTRMRYSNIQIRAVDRALFAPPPGAAIVYSDKPEGIIRGSQEEVQEILERSKNPPPGRRYGIV